MKKLLVISCITVLTLSACGGFTTSEKERYVSALTESMCEALTAPDVLDSALLEKTNEIFENYGFDTEDHEKMKEIEEKYSSDPEVVAGIKSAVEECAGPLFDQIDANDVEEDVEPEVEVEETEESVEE